MSERERAKRFFEQLTRHHPSPSTHVLYQRVCDFLTTMVQDDVCLAKKSHGNRFRDLLCDFSMAYVPVPLREDMARHGELVNGMRQLGEGSNGRIFQSGAFQGNPIVTKTKKKVTEHTIYEIYINFVVLNEMIIKQQFEKNLIPTYGLFLCPTNDDGTQICVPMNKQEHLFLVQHQIEGKTLARHLHAGMSLPRYKEIVKQLMRVLIGFESSEHQLYHTDLHCSNIILSEPDLQPVLLDFELASFRIQENGKSHRFRLNSLEHKYTLHEHVLSGAHDLALLFSNTIAYRNPDIQAYCLDMVQRIYSHYWTDINKPFVITQSWINAEKEHRWIYHALKEAEDKLPEEQRKKVHEHNITTMHKMTYKWLEKELNL